MRAFIQFMLLFKYAFFDARQFVVVATMHRIFDPNAYAGNIVWVLAVK